MATDNLVYFVTAINCISWVASAKNLTFLALTLLNVNPDAVTYPVVAGQWLAIQGINNDSNLLPDYTLNLKVFDAEGDIQVTLRQTLEIIKYESTEDHIYSPVILGHPWSSLCSTAAPILNAFNMGLISEAATSILLSDTNQFPYFYRTIPNDAIQAEGMIALCLEFKWNSIVIVYNSGPYGSSLSLGIQELAIKNNIEAASIAVNGLDDASYEFAAKQVKDLEIYIIVLIAEASTLPPFKIFEREGITGYPYYYLGVDTWLSSGTISNWNAVEIAQGFIGTTPWDAMGLELDEYEPDQRDIVEQSAEIVDNIFKSWDWYYYNGYNQELYNVSMPYGYMVYGYDALYTMAHAFSHILDFDPSFDFTNASNTMKAINQTLINNTDFIGATGRVTFDQNGDRINGLYSFGNVLENGSIAYFGYFYKDLNGTIRTKINRSKIIFPSDFIDKGINPRSEPLITSEISPMNSTAPLIFMILLSISILIVFFFMVYWIYFRDNTIISAESWKLNCLMMFGALFGYLCAMLHQVEFFSNNTNIMGNICMVKLLLFNLSFTMFFMPLFMKTYRINRLFWRILTQKRIHNRKLYIAVLFCGLIDVALLVILFIIKPMKWIMIKDDLVEIDTLRKVQYQHGQCLFEDHTTSRAYINVVFYGIITLWICVKLIFGLHIASVILNIKEVTKELSKFDKTGIQRNQIFILKFVYNIFNSEMIKIRS